MDIRYFDYIEQSDKYYVPSELKGEKFILKVPENWEVLEGKHWVNIYSKDTYLKQDQGWKLHISADVFEAQSVLNTVARILFERGIPFKFVIDKTQLIAKNSKYAARESSAKFITIYPNEEDLYMLLLKLEEGLKDYKKGAYILSDRRWKDSNIYYRYGGYSAKYLPDGRLGIQDNEGNLVEDKRLPYYSTPDWVVKPKFILENECEVYQENPLEAYDIKEALHFSNGGGVYLATDRFSKKIILKEARLNAGLDGLNYDAIHRLQKEYSILSKLSDIQYVPKVYDIFSAWEHKFLVQEYIEGETLASWIARNYPFSEKSNTAEYVGRLKKIAVECCSALEMIHKKGYTHGDIQPKNIIVTDDNKIKLIDFENFGKVGKRGERTLGTPGFYKKYDDYNEEKDWTGMLRVFKAGLLAVANLEMISNDVYDIHYEWIKRDLGEEATDILDMIVNYSSSKKFDILDNGKKPFRMFRNLEEQFIYQEVIKSLHANMNIQKKSLIYGDIKQYIYKQGELSIAYGAAGILLLLKRLDKLNFDTDLWFNNLNIEIFDSNYGLFSGGTGFANMLIELGYKNYANNIYKRLLENKNGILGTNNISLESGLSGIGLATLDQYVSTKNKEYLKYSEEIYKKIINIFEESPTEISNELSGFTNDGLMYGWTGVIWFAYSLYNITEKEEYINFAKDLFNNELDKIILENEMAFLKSEDDKLLPYLSNGSSGLLLTAMLMKDHIEENIIDDLIRGVSNAITAKPPVFFGLFEGYTGLAYVAKIIDEYTGGVTSLYKKVAMNYNQYILRDSEGNMAVPGNFSFRVSYDLATGLGGLLSCVNKESFPGFIWLPLKNQNKLLKNNKL